MTITIKYFGITYSIETKTDDLNSTEILETFTNLMKCIDFNKVLLMVQLWNLMNKLIYELRKNNNA